MHTNVPKRIQRKRIKGYRTPPNTIYVGRPGRYGNPFNWEDAVEAGYTTNAAKRLAVQYFENWLKNPDLILEPTEHLEDRRQYILEHIHELNKRNLSCWCKEGLPCHGDVLLRLANE